MGQAVRQFLLIALSTGLGAAAGVVWWLLVPLSTYRVGGDGKSATTERGLAGMIAGDAYFCAIGLVVGLAIGIVGWRVLQSLGWSLVPLVVICSLGAALVCWWVGYQLGPGDFSPRIAVASPGDLVPIELTLRAKASLLSWPFFAVLPVLLASSLGREPDAAEPEPVTAVEQRG